MPRTYQSQPEQVFPISSQERGPERSANKKRRSSILDLPLEQWDDGRWWHSAREAAAILQECCGKEGFSYESLLAALTNGEYIEGFHWFRRGTAFKVNLRRIIKYPPGSLD
ncbi:MAG: hypothetical protein WCA35_22835 [Kovacikia sp.]